MPDPHVLAFLTGTSETFSELAPFLIVMGAGFLVGAWGQSARVPVAVIAGILLIILAIGGSASNGSGPDQSP